MERAVHINYAERDAKLVAVVQRALQAMVLTHGNRITMGDNFGTLNFEREMLGLREGLLLLDVDPDEPVVGI